MVLAQQQLFAFSKERVCEPLGGSGLVAAVVAQSVFLKEQVRQVNKRRVTHRQTLRTSRRLTRVVIS